MKDVMQDNVVLVGILKRKRDRAMLLTDHWYHMPVAKAPRRPFRYLAFYEPARFGVAGKRIRYYARVRRTVVRKRRELFPRETAHPAAAKKYRQIFVGPLRTLPHPIMNMPPRRISFGFTTLRRLRAARTILELFWVYPSEAIVARALARERIHVIPQYQISSSGKRYRLDFAIFAGDRRVAIECDNEKAHAGKVQRRKDRIKDAYLRRAGWRVVRLREQNIIGNLDSCVERIVKAAGRR